MSAADFILPAIAAAMLTAPLGVRTSHAEDAAISGLSACAKQSDDAERLGCYDRLARQVAADRSRAPTAPAPPSVSAPEMFGARPSTAAKSTDGIAPAELKSISAKVTAMSGGERTGATVTLDNGQQWQQIGHEDLLLKVGDRVKISRGAFDGFWLMTEGNRLAHFKRIL